VVIASGGEPLFHTLGLVFCLLATAGRALKTVVRRRRGMLCQMMLADSGG
jgi:hypothetical protein